MSDPLPLIPPLPDNIDPEVAEALTFAIHRAIRCCDFDDQECEEHVPWVLRRLHEAGFELVKIAKGSA